MTVRAPKFAEYSHDPQAVLDYPFNWEAWLTVDDVILAATVVLDDIFDSAGQPVDLIDDTTPVEVDLVTNTDTLVVAWLSGGTLGYVYILTCHVTTADGREEDKSIRLFVQQH